MPESLRKRCREELLFMVDDFKVIERLVPLPVQISWADGFVWRYQEKTVGQALVQKLARSISGLHAIDVLLLNGFVQEQAAIQRMLDEIDEDITFLALGVLLKKWTVLHDDYMANFWAEEFEPGRALATHKSRPMVSRKKIRAAVSRMWPGGNPSFTDRVSAVMAKTYSGYVHAASPMVMDMVGDNPPRFFVQGMHGTERMLSHAHDAVNYFYRTLVAFQFVFRVVEAHTLADRAYVRAKQFEQDFASTHLPDDAAVAKNKRDAAAASRR